MREAILSDIVRSNVTYTYHVLKFWRPQCETTNVEGRKLTSAMGWLVGWLVDWLVGYLAFCLVIQSEVTIVTSIGNV